MHCLPEERPPFVVVAGIAFGATTMTVARAAVRAAATQPCAHVHLVHVAPSAPVAENDLGTLLPGDGAEAALEEVARHLAAIGRDLHAPPHVLVHAHALVGAGPKVELAAFARVVGASLLVVGSRGFAVLQPIRQTAGGAVPTPGGSVPPRQLWRAPA